MTAPVYTNRGVVTSLSLGKQTLSDLAFFDAYSASIDTCPFELMDDLERSISTALRCDGEYQKTGHLKFYGENKAFVTEGGKRLFNVQYGGANVKPLVQCTGVASRHVSEVLRSHTDKHSPVRIDAALDIAGEGLFDRLEAITRQMAKAFSVSWRPVGDWVTPEAGRTIEVGSRRSEVFFRVYEKGFEMQAKHRVALDDLARQTVRVEVEFKPRSIAAKRKAVVIRPPELFALNKTLRQLVSSLSNEVLQPVLVREPRSSDRDKALRWMVRQYGGHLESLLQECEGDLALFGGRLFDIGKVVRNGST